MQTPYAIKKLKNQLLKIKTADYTILPDTEDMWATFSNSGATTQLSIQLPAALIGMGFRFIVEAAYCFTAKPATGESIALPSTGAQSTANYVVEANAVGESAEFECKVKGDWDCNKSIGTWTARAD